MLEIGRKKALTGDPMRRQVLEESEMQKLRLKKNVRILHPDVQTIQNYQRNE
jgi:hypothetical protein